ncbi:integrase core domain-containing protein [Nocardia gipuzkoensis]
MLRRPVESAQCTAIAFAETRLSERVSDSIGSVGDAYDNALPESTIGLFKTEARAKDSPFHAGPVRSLDDVKYVTLEWVDWYNNRRLHSLLVHIPPAEYETASARTR